MNLYSKLRNLYEKKIELSDCDPEILADLCSSLLKDYPLKFIPTIEIYSILTKRQEVWMKKLPREITRIRRSLGLSMAAYAAELDDRMRG